MIEQQPTQGEAQSTHVLWRAVLERDARFDGVVFYGVVTTGVFCRPGCPSRRPRPENVRLFNQAHAAAEAGFRACKRCRPEQLETYPSGTTGGDDHSRLVAACRFIEGELEVAPTLVQIAKALASTPDQIRQLFRRTLGVSPKQYLDAVRIERFKARLGEGDDIAGATYEAGYGSSSRVYERASKRLGMRPAAYRGQGAGETVYFEAWSTDDGAALVAYTERGVCSVKLGQFADELVAALQAEFSAAVLAPARAGNPWVRAVAEYLRDARPLDPTLPTDVGATAFQAKVWAALRQIPAGETRSYSEVAESIGAPRAVRAVASACARNPVALVVPCHRVLPKGAGIEAPGEYRWGRDTKARLLARERREPGSR